MTLLNGGLLLLGLAPVAHAAHGQDDNYGVIDDRPLRTQEESRDAGRLEVPRNDGWVTDLAGLLSQDEERELEDLMKSYKAGTTHEIALLTVPSLRGEPIERFALEVGRAWGMGTKEKSNAALLLVSKEDRALRIEVGDGLEGTLTDSISGRIIRDVIVPEFRRGRFAQGLKEGVLAMHEAIGGDYHRVQRTRSSSGLPLLFLLPPLLIFAVIVFTILRIARRGTRGRRRRGWRTSNWGDWGGPLLGGLGGSSWGGSHGGGSSGGGFSGFGGGGGFHGGGASGSW